MKKKLTITIDERLYNIIVGLAHEANRSLSNWVECQLQAAVDAEKGQDTPSNG